MKPLRRRRARFNFTLWMLPISMPIIGALLATMGFVMSMNDRPKAAAYVGDASCGAALWSATPPGGACTIVAGTLRATSSHVEGGARSRSRVVDATLSLPGEPLQTVSLVDARFFAVATSGDAIRAELLRGAVTRIADANNPTVAWETNDDPLFAAEGASVLTWLGIGAFVLGAFGIAGLRWILR